MPCPASAGRKVSLVLAPVWSPVPDSSTGLAIVRLRGVVMVRDVLQALDERGEPAQRGGLTQHIAVAAGRIAGHGGPLGDVADDAALGGHARSTVHGPGVGPAGPAVPPSRSPSRRASPM